MYIKLPFLFAETIQTGLIQPHPLLTSSLPPSVPGPPRLPILNGGGNGNRGNSLGGLSAPLMTSSEKSVGDSVEKLSPCCRYRQPAIVSLFSVGFIMIITFLVLYWNYHETIHRRMTKKQGYILDHWGKGSPSAAETAVLDLEVEILKEEQRETRRKEAQRAMSRPPPGSTTTSEQPQPQEELDDLLVIDGRPLDDETPTTITSLDGLDSRLD